MLVGPSRERAVGVELRFILEARVTSTLLTDPRCQMKEEGSLGRCRFLLGASGWKLPRRFLPNRLQTQMSTPPTAAVGDATSLATPTPSCSRQLSTKPRGGSAHPPARLASPPEPWCLRRGPQPSRPGCGVGVRSRFKCLGFSPLRRVRGAGASMAVGSPRPAVLGVVLAGLSALRASGGRLRPPPHFHDVQTQASL